MKRFCLIIFLFLFVGNIIKCQDLIVTNKGDSINCKITNYRKNNMYFTLRDGNEIRNTMIPMEQIKYYQKNYYSKSDIPLNKVNRIGNYSKLRISFQGGYSYQLAKIGSDVPQIFQDYYKKLKNGYSFGGDIDYFTSDRFGFGFKFSIFRTHNELDNIVATDTLTGVVKTGSLKDNITIQYFGPEICTRLHTFNNKTIFIADMSLGYLGYQDNATLIDNYTVTGNTVGLMLDIGVDFMIDDHFSFGGLVSYTVGSLNTININNGTTTETIKLNNNELIGLNRLDLSVGFRYNL